MLNSTLKLLLKVPGVREQIVIWLLGQIIAYIDKRLEKWLERKDKTEDALAEIERRVAEADRKTQEIVEDARREFAEDARKGKE